MRKLVWCFFNTVTNPVTALDIVWCQFPFVEIPDQPGPKARPALVRRVLELEGSTYVEVAYGTSNPRSYSSMDLYVANSLDLNEMRLPQATIFQLKRTVTLPWAEEWFTKRPDGSGPVISHLNTRMEKYLQLLKEHL